MTSFKWTFEVYRNLIQTVYHVFFSSFFFVKAIKDENKAKKKIIYLIRLLLFYVIESVTSIHFICLKAHTIKVFILTESESEIQVDVMCFMCVYANHTTVSKNKKKNNHTWSRIFQCLSSLTLFDFRCFAWTHKIFGFYRQK